MERLTPCGSAEEEKEDIGKLVQKIYFKTCIERLFVLNIFIKIKIKHYKPTHNNITIINIFSN